MSRNPHYTHITASIVLRAAVAALARNTTLRAQLGQATGRWMLDHPNRSLADVMVIEYNLKRIGILEEL